MEAEVTAKLLRRGIRPYDVPISYRARNREEGKKITWRDGVEALWILGRHRVGRPCLDRSEDAHRTRWAETWGGRARAGTLPVKAGVCAVAARPDAVRGNALCGTY
jgi:hypothetical protein